MDVLVMLQGWEISGFPKIDFFGPLYSNSNREERGFGIYRVHAGLFWWLLEFRIQGLGFI